MNTLLTVKDLSVSFFLYEGELKVLDNIKFNILPQEVFGMVGESGSGKTVTAFSVMNLIEAPGVILNGEVLFEGEDLLKMSERDMRKIRGKKISMVFQQAKTALNPFMRIGDQISRIYKTHQKVDRTEAKHETINLLSKVGIPEAEKRARDYPHQFSGGMCQRAMIALMTACHPKLLIVDEPTTGLDVTTQAQILELMREIQHREGSSIWLITHDLGIAAQTCDRIAVMHAGHIVEEAKTATIFSNPQHPYTKFLLQAIPRVDKRTKLKNIPGNVPSLLSPPRGCRFLERCPYKIDKCVSIKPDRIEVEPGHFVMCHLYLEG